MATKDQYEVFKHLYSLEEGRSRALGDTAKTYLLIISAFFGLVGLVLGERAAFIATKAWIGNIPLGVISLVAAILCVVAGLVFTLRALFVHDYEGIVDEEDFFEETVANGYNDPTFFDVFISNMVVRRPVGLRPRVSDCCVVWNSEQLRDGPRWTSEPKRRQQRCAKRRLLSRINERVGKLLPSRVSKSLRRQSRNARSCTVGAYWFESKPRLRQSVIARSPRRPG